MKKIIVSKSGAKAGTATHTVTNTGDVSKAFRLVHGQVVLTTDATAANRRLIATVKDAAGSTLVDIHAGAVVPASQTSQHHEMLQGVYRETAFVGSALQVPIPMECIIPAGGSLVISIENGVAGDSYTANLTFESY